MKTLFVTFGLMLFAQNASALWCVEGNVWFPDCFNTIEECETRKIELIARERGSYEESFECNQHDQVYEIAMVNAEPSSNPRTPEATIAAQMDIQVNYLRAFSIEECQAKFVRHERATMWGIPHRLVTRCYATTLADHEGPPNSTWRDHPERRHVSAVVRLLETWVSNQAASHWARQENIAFHMQDIARRFSSSWAYIPSRVPWCFHVGNVDALYEEERQSMLRDLRQPRINRLVRIVAASRMAERLGFLEDLQTEVASSIGSEQRRLRQIIEFVVDRTSQEELDQEVVQTIADSVREAVARRIHQSVMQCASRTGSPINDVLNNIAEFGND